MNARNLLVPARISGALSGVEIYLTRSLLNAKALKWYVRWHKAQASTGQYDLCSVNVLLKPVSYSDCSFASRFGSTTQYVSKGENHGGRNKRPEKLSGSRADLFFRAASAFLSIDSSRALGTHLYFSEHSNRGMRDVQNSNGSMHDIVLEGTSFKAGNGLGRRHALENRTRRQLGVESDQGPPCDNWDSFASTLHSARPVAPTKHAAKLGAGPLALKGLRTSGDRSIRRRSKDSV
jgi:hypothetical protein